VYKKICLVFTALLLIGFGYVLGCNNDTTVTGDTGSKTVRAEEFVLLDEAGEVVAILGSIEEGTAGLSFYCKEGEPRMDIAHVGGQSEIAFYGEPGRLRMSLVASPDHVSIGINNEAGQPAILAGITDEEPGVSLYYKDNKPATSMSVVQGEPRFNIWDKELNQLFHAP